MKLSLLLCTSMLTSYCFGQKESVRNGVKPQRQANYFESISGGMNASYRNDQVFGGFDLSIQTCHYFLITGRRIKSDSLHQLAIQKRMKLIDVYRGLHLFLLNRSSMNLDSIESTALSYITSLRPSPCTFRIQKELFLTKQHAISRQNMAPVLSLIFTGDARLVPFIPRNEKMEFGASGNLFISFKTLFKRIELNERGKIIDQGTMYFTPSFGFAYGTTDLYKNISTSNSVKPIYSTELRIGFESEKNSLKDFSFLLNYALSDIRGPKLQVGLLLTAP